MTATKANLAAPEFTSLSNDLLTLYDEVAEQGDCCAFLYEAFASLAGREDALDSSAIDGLRCISDWMQQRMTGIQDQLRAVQEKCDAENVNLEKALPK